MNSIDAQKILDYLESGVFCLDKTLTIRQVNASAEVIFDKSDHMLINHPFKHLLKAPEKHSIISSLDTALRENHHITERGAILNLTDGRQLRIDYFIHPIVDMEDLCILLEILPMERHVEIARDELRSRQQAASQQLARGMAHEIKNPLGGIRGAAQLLDGEISDPSLKEYTEVIIREADRLQDLLNSMLGPNRKINTAQLNILEVLEHVQSVIQAEFKNIKIKRDYDTSIPEVEGDKNLLIQAYLNIMRNAAQASDSGGIIKIKARINRQYTIGRKRFKHVIQIDIADNGPGIADTVRDNIFLPMVTDKPNGTGLGLPIAQQILFDHQGVIQCQSQPGKTTFSTFLPLQHEP